MDKLLPQVPEAEESIICACLIFPDSREEVVERLIPEDFYVTLHQKIYRVILAMDRQQETVDLITVAFRLKNTEALPAGFPDGTGWASILARLTNTVPVAVSVNAHIELIKDASVKRQMLQKFNKLLNMCFDPGQDTGALLETAQEEVLGIEYGKRGRDYASIGEAVAESMDRLGEFQENGGGLSGVRSGYRAVDEMTCGFQPSDLIILAARPSMGKTALALNIAEHAADFDTPVAIFSLEMSKTQLANRMLSKLSRVNGERFKGDKFQQKEWDRIHEAAGMLYNQKIYINDTPDMSHMDIRREARRLKKAHGIGLVIIDYLQLASGEKTGNRTNEIDSISRGFKNLARELDVPVIALSQLNRMLEQRQDKRPILADLRESGSIEQDADVVMFLYRDEVYNRDENNPNRGIAEVLFAKNRNGATGRVRLTWKKEHTAFYDLTPGY